MKNLIEWAKNLKKHLTKGYIQMKKMHMKASPHFTSQGRGRLDMGELGAALGGLIIH